MSLDAVKQLHRTNFSIPRFTDKQITEKLEALLEDGGYKVDLWQSRKHQRGVSG
ncbi:MAG: hypothetical protein O3C40_00890 [Planctomycetota bacterium]|nr:hypothetical protein [Planctomycetota bacterium]